jgi:hypothetical protein
VLVYDWPATSELAVRREGHFILALYLMGVGGLVQRLRRVTDSSYLAKRRGLLVRQLYLRHCRISPSNVMLSVWKRTERSDNQNYFRFDILY